MKVMLLLNGFSVFKNSKKTIPVLKTLGIVDTDNSFDSVSKVVNDALDRYSDAIINYYYNPDSRQGLFEHERQEFKDQYFKTRTYKPQRLLKHHGINPVCLATLNYKDLHSYPNRTDTVEVYRIVLD